MRIALRLIVIAAAATAASATTAHAATTSLIAAYDTYVPGQGFQIKLVDIGTGADIPLPNGVNTTADELHPALSANGRFLVFTRTQLQPLLDGSVIPPTQRTLVMVDRSDGTVRAPVSGSSGDGDSAASIMPTTNTTDKLSYGRRPPVLPANDANTDRFFKLAVLDPPAFFPAPGNDLTVGMLPEEERLDGNSIFEITGTSFAQRAGARTHAYSISRFDQGTGALLHSQTIFESRPGTAAARDATFTYGGGSINAQENGHPALRLPDGFAAFDVTVGTSSSRNGSIHTILLPNQTVDSPAPAGAINTTASDERAPAWSPDGNKLGFIRTNTSTGARTLLTFDSTPGVQALLNEGTSLGAAPTPQLRAFESAFGGIALATETRPDSLVLGCTRVCLSTLSNQVLTAPVKLAPVATTKATQGTKVGIIVAKIKGATTLLGRKVPKIQPLGRVPLGKAKKGRNSFTWNGKVNGKTLTKGDYLLTFRALTAANRVRSTSESLRFSVSKKGKITGVKTVSATD